jgi:ferredoxin
MDEQIPHSISVDRDMCQSAATCLAFHMYELDDEVKAVLLTNNGLNSDEPRNPLVIGNGEVLISDLLNPEGKTAEEMRALALESAKICPFNAIIVRDAEGSIIWPA